MTNNEFIDKYGKLEFKEMCRNISQDLVIRRIKKEIGGYTINNTKKVVKFYRKDKTSINVDFALIFTLSNKKIKEYIDSK